MFEKISVTRRAAFNEYTLKIEFDYEDVFYALWQSYRAEHPAETVQRSRDEMTKDKNPMQLSDGYNLWSLSDGENTLYRFKNVETIL